MCARARPHARAWLWLGRVRAPVSLCSCVALARVCARVVALGCAECAPAPLWPELEPDKAVRTRLCVCACRACFLLRRECVCVCVCVCACVCVCVCGIAQMLNTEFNELSDKPSLDLYPAELRAKIDEINEWVYPHINNGVYRWCVGGDGGGGGGGVCVCVLRACSVRENLSLPPPERENHL